MNNRFVGGSSSETFSHPIHMMMIIIIIIIMLEKLREYMDRNMKIGSRLGKVSVKQNYKFTCCFVWV
jgi:hypothetical protein